MSEKGAHLPNHGISRTLQRLESRRTKLCAALSAWSPEEQRYRSTPASWCVLEVVDHLVRTESSILAMMCRNLSAGNPIPLRDRYRTLALKVLMRTPIRVKAPQSAARLVAPSDLQDFDSLTRKWIKERTQLAAFVNSLTEEQQNSGLFHHPVGGWTDAAGALAFLDAHLAHHQFQINRIRTAWQRRPQTRRSLVQAGEA